MVKFAERHRWGSLVGFNDFELCFIDETVSTIDNVIVVRVSGGWDKQFKFRLGTC